MTKINYTASPTVYSPTGERFVEVIAHYKGGPAVMVFMGSIEETRQLRDILNGCIALYGESHSLSLSSLEEVVAVLDKDKSMNASDVADKLGITHVAARLRLARAARVGTIRRVKYGRYCRVGSPRSDQSS